MNSNNISRSLQPLPSLETKPFYATSPEKLSATNFDTAIDDTVCGADKTTLLLLQQQQEQTSRKVLKWWNNNLPLSYHKSLDEQTKLQHLTALISLKLISKQSSHTMTRIATTTTAVKPQQDNQVVDSSSSNQQHQHRHNQEIIMFSNDGLKCTILRDGSAYVGLLYEVVQTVILPYLKMKRMVLREAMIYSSLRGDLVIDVFEFESLDHHHHSYEQGSLKSNQEVRQDVVEFKQGVRQMKQKELIDIICNKRNSNSSISTEDHTAAISSSSLQEYLDACDIDYVLNTSPKDIKLHHNMLYSFQKDTTVRVVIMEQLDGDYSKKDYGESDFDDMMFEFEDRLTVSAAANGNGANSESDPGASNISFYKATIMIPIDELNNNSNVNEFIARIIQYVSMKQRLNIEKARIDKVIFPNIYYIIFTIDISCMKGHIDTVAFCDDLSRICFLDAEVLKEFYHGHSDGSSNSSLVFYEVFMGMVSMCLFIAAGNTNLKDLIVKTVLGRYPEAAKDIVAITMSGEKSYVLDEALLKFKMGHLRLVEEKEVSMLFGEWLRLLQSQVILTINVKKDKRTILVIELDGMKLAMKSSSSLYYLYGSGLVGFYAFKNKDFLTRINVKYFDKSTVINLFNESSGYCLFDHLLNRDIPENGSCGAVVLDDDLKSIEKASCIDQLIINEINNKNLALDSLLTEEEKTLVVSQTIYTCLFMLVNKMHMIAPSSSQSKLSVDIFYAGSDLNKCLNAILLRVAQLEKHVAIKTLYVFSNGKHVKYSFKGASIAAIAKEITQNSKRAVPFDVDELRDSITDICVSINNSTTRIEPLYGKAGIIVLMDVYHPTSHLEADFPANVLLIDSLTTMKPFESFKSYKMFHKFVLKESSERTPNFIEETLGRLEFFLKIEVDLILKDFVIVNGLSKFSYDFALCMQNMKDFMSLDKFCNLFLDNMHQKLMIDLSRKDKDRPTNFYIDSNFTYNDPSSSYVQLYKTLLLEFVLPCIKDQIDQAENGVLRCILETIAPEYLKKIILTAISKRIIYKEGQRYVQNKIRKFMAFSSEEQCMIKWAFDYLIRFQNIRQLIVELNDSRALKDQTKAKIIKELEKSLDVSADEE